MNVTTFFCPKSLASRLRRTDAEEEYRARKSDMMSFYTDEGLTLAGMKK